MLFRFLRPLLVFTEAGDADQTGTTYKLTPGESDPINDSAQLFKVFIDASQAGGATSPTVDVVIETSHDGQSWVPVASATQLTADGSAHELKDLLALGPFVRARSVLAGGTKPDHTAVVKLASNGDFKLEALT